MNKSNIKLLTTGVRLQIIVIQLILFLPFVAEQAASAENLDNRWKYFASNVAGCKFYYDSESVICLPNNVVKVWEKSLCPETTGYVVLEMTTLKEIDCNKRTYRQLQMEGTKKDGSGVFDFQPSGYGEIRPESLTETLYHTICKKNNHK